jgi:hypothetical protein
MKTILAHRLLAAVDFTNAEMMEATTAYHRLL